MTTTTDYYTTKVYHEIIPAELHGSHPKPDLRLSYKGFPIECLPPYHLYEITAREGCDLPNMLAGKFTKIEMVHQQIDYYLQQEPKATVETAYKKRPEKRGRGRPKKTDVTEPQKTKEEAIT